MGRLWETARFVLEDSESRATQFPTGCAGVWKTLSLDHGLREHGMLEQANTHRVTTTGFPHPSSQCGGARRLLRRGTLFSCQSSDGIQNGFLSGRQRKGVDSEQTTLSKAVDNDYRHFFSHLEFPSVTSSSGLVWPKIGGPVPGEN
jgi:hypothetical protein